MWAHHTRDWCAPPPIRYREDMRIRAQGVWGYLVVGAVVLGLWAGTAGAKEGWKGLIGKSCPSFHVEQWLNTGGLQPKPADLVGSVWMLEFLSVG